jgi:hypothetical protein
MRSPTINSTLLAAIACTDARTIDENAIGKSRNREHSVLITDGVLDSLIRVDQ